MESSENPALPAAWAARLRLESRQCLLYAGQTLTLGRSAENDIVFDDLKISRSHAILEWNGTGFTLRDLGSVNGTFVNQQRLFSGARLLRDGDVLRLGALEMRYEIARASSPDLWDPADHIDPADPVDPAAQPVAEAPVASEIVLGKTTAAMRLPVSPQLLVTMGPDMGQEYPLWGEQITIGRASREATWEIRLTDRSVSRPHARLQQGEEGYFLTDLESANGTLLNGAPLVGTALLKDGDEIGVGETRLVLKLYLGLQAG